MNKAVTKFLIKSIIYYYCYYYYMACVCRRYNQHSDWLIVTEL